MTAIVLLSGCATSRPDPARGLMRPREDQMAAFGRAQQTLERSFPSAFQATHRAVITVGRRQYACDGFLSVEPEQGMHLALVSALGLVGEVRQRTDGTGDVLKVTPLFRESWSLDYVLRDLRCLFGPPGTVHPTGTTIDGRLALEPTAPAGSPRIRYLISADGRRWEGLELCERRRPVYRATVQRHRQYAGWSHELPSELSVDAGAYQLHLRVVEWTARAPAGAAGTTREVVR